MKQEHDKLWWESSLILTLKGYVKECLFLTAFVKQVNVLVVSLINKELCKKKTQAKNPNRLEKTIKVSQDKLEPDTTTTTHHKNKLNS